MNTTKLHIGYVRDDRGNVFVQLPADNQWGFSLFDDDQEFPGGFGIGRWTAISADQTSEADHARLSWLLTEATA